MKDGNCEQMEDALWEHRLEVENRIKNLFWTVSGDYTIEFEPRVEDYARSKHTALYEAIKQGAFAKHFDLNQLGLYLMKKMYFSADEKMLLELSRLCIDVAVYPLLQKERFGTEEIRAQAFGEWLEAMEDGFEQNVLAQAKLLVMRQAMDGVNREYERKYKISQITEEHGNTLEQARMIRDEILSLENAKDTEDVINAREHIYNAILDPDFECKHGNLQQILKLPALSLTQDAWQECMTDEQMEQIIQKCLSDMKKKMMSLEIEENKKRRSFLGGGLQEDETEQGEINQQAVKRVQEYVELNYGKSYLTSLEQDRMNRKLCNGIHKDCILYLTDGILHNPVIKNNQYRFSQLQFEKNRMYYGNHHRVMKRNITALADSLKRAFVLRNDDNFSRSVTGKLVPNRLWKITRTKDDKLFDQKKKSENSEFVVDILLDSSGSQAKRQSQVAAQGYMISEALSEAGIPHRVSGYCAFWGYTVLQRFRDYEASREENSRIFEFRAYANNRDGLALKAVCASLMERPEENKILIVLSDGRPCDMSVKRHGTRQPAIYDGEEAIKDTAFQVRRARNQGISVIGIFVGDEADLPVEKRIFGKDFAYIRNISGFSRMVGTFLRRQIDVE